MTQRHETHELLREYGLTPPEVRAVLEGQWHAFEKHLRSRQGDWTQVQPGREWTPAQEAQHVLLVNGGAMRAVRLLLSDRELRPMPREPGVLKDGKRQSPAFAQPSADGLPWSELEVRLTEQRAALLELAAAARPTPERRFWHPFLGELDALDWLRSLAAHLRHHRERLERSAS